MKSLSKLLSILSLTAACLSGSAHAIFIVELNEELAEEAVYSSPSALEKQITISQSKPISKLHDYQTIFNASNIYGVSLSPNGKYLNYFEKSGPDHNRIISLWIYDIATKASHKLFSTKQLSNVRWTVDSQSMFFETRKSIAVVGVDKNSAPQILFDKNNRYHDKIISDDNTFTNSIIVRRWHPETKQYQVLRVENNGKESVIYQTPHRFSSFGLDAAGNPSILSRYNEADDNKGEKYIVDIADKQEKILWHCEWDDQCGAIYFDRKRQNLLLISNYQSDLTRLALIDLSSNSVKTVHSDPLNRADLSDAAFQFDKKKQLISAPIINYHGDYLKNYSDNKELQQHINFIEKKLATSSMSISASLSQDINQQPWLIIDNNNAYSAVRYYLYQPTTKTLTRPLKSIVEQANENKPMLEQYDIAEKFPIHYTSRDGYQLQGYLTLPFGVDISKAPLVTNVHGGPWSRVTDKYQRSTQLLTNRGYIVFEPNFRSSTGFGKDYLTSTKGEHGDGRIQHDIIDGVRYLLSNNIGDKDRVAVVGHSFGAYSVLAALAYTPDFFQVGFAGAPPHDIARSAKYYYRFTKQKNQFNPEYFMKQLVVDWDDKALMAQHYARSPAAHAKHIKKPLVMWAGKNDRRVFIADVKDYALNVESMDKQVSLFIDPKAMHSPSSKIGIYAYQYLLEKSLADNIGGKLKSIDPIKDKKLWRFLNKNMAIDHNKLL